MKQFQPGDRVRVLIFWANKYPAPFRRLIVRGRIATVGHVENGGAVFVRFDKKKPSANRREGHVYAEHLILVNEAGEPV